MKKYLCSVYPSAKTCIFFLPLTNISHILISFKLLFMCICSLTYFRVFLFVCLFCFFGLFRAIPMAMEVPRLGAELELQLLAYTTATATGDPSRVCDLHQSSRQCRILTPLSKARDQTRVLMDASRIRFRWATRGNSGLCCFRWERLTVILNVVHVYIMCLFIFPLTTFKVPLSLAFWQFDHDIPRCVSFYDPP